MPRKGRGLGRETVNFVKKIFEAEGEWVEYPKALSETAFRYRLRQLNEGKFTKGDLKVEAIKAEKKGSKYTLKARAVEQ